MNKLSLVYDQVGEQKKGLELDQQIYSLRCKVLGEDHPDTLTSLGNLAYSYGTVADYRKEIELREKLYALRVKLQGEQHPDAVKDLEHLCEAREKFQNQNRERKRCRHCGGAFEGLFHKKCSKCGKTKDY